MKIMTSNIGLELHIPEEFDTAKLKDGDVLWMFSNVKKKNGKIKGVWKQIKVVEKEWGNN